MNFQQQLYWKAFLSNTQTCIVLGKKELRFVVASYNCFIQYITWSSFPNISECSEEKQISCLENFATWSPRLKDRINNYLVGNVFGMQTTSYFPPFQTPQELGTVSCTIKSGKYTFFKVNFEASFNITYETTSKVSNIVFSECQSFDTANFFRTNKRLTSRML